MSNSDEHIETRDNGNEAIGTSTDLSSSSENMTYYVPEAAKFLLDYIASIEAPMGYETLYGNNQRVFERKITEMSLSEIIEIGPTLTRRFKSSACGRYQFMAATLRELHGRLSLGGDELFSPGFQDMLAYRLLVKRGYSVFMAGNMNIKRFGLQLAREWASLPVLELCKGHHRMVHRGESYYSGDRLNKSLVKAENFEAAILTAKSIYENKMVRNTHASNIEDDQAEHPTKIATTYESSDVPWSLNQESDASIQEFDTKQDDNGYEKKWSYDGDNGNDYKNNNQQNYTEDNRGALYQHATIIEDNDGVTSGDDTHMLPGGWNVA